MRLRCRVLRQGLGSYLPGFKVSTCRSKIIWGLVPVTKAVSRVCPEAGTILSCSTSNSISAPSVALLPQLRCISMPVYVPTRIRTPTCTLIYIYLCIYIYTHTRFYLLASDLSVSVRPQILQAPRRMTRTHPEQGYGGGTSLRPQPENLNPPT